MQSIHFIQKYSTILLKNNTNKIIYRTLSRVIVIHCAKPLPIAARVRPYSQSSYNYNRSDASMHGGTLKPKALSVCDPITASEKGDPVQSDQTGHHAVVVAKVCSNKECKDTNCAQGTKVQNACGLSADDHQTVTSQITVNGTVTVLEMAGALTHGIPPQTPFNASNLPVYYLLLCNKVLYKKKILLLFHPPMPMNVV